MRDAGRQRVEDRQEGDQRHHRIDEPLPEALDRGGKAHRVFLDALRGALDGAQPAPVRDEIIVHRRAPAEDVVADEEHVQNRDRDADQRQRQELDDAEVEIGRRDRAGRAEGALHHVVEDAAPIVQGDADLDVEMGDDDDQAGPQDRPVFPWMRRDRAPEGVEGKDAQGEIAVEPEEVRLEEARGADDRRRVGRGLGDAEDVAETLAGGEPQQDEEHAPAERGQEEQLRLREEGNEHGRNPRTRSRGAGCRASAVWQGQAPVRRRTIAAGRWPSIDIRLSVTRKLQFGGDDGFGRQAPRRPADQPIAAAASKASAAPAEGAAKLPVQSAP